MIGAPHPVGIEVGVVAEGNAHRHQRERDRETEHDDENEGAQHEQGDLRIGHRRVSPSRSGPATSRPSAAALSRTSAVSPRINLTSVSSMSSRAKVQYPSRMHLMQRMT